MGINANYMTLNTLYLINNSYPPSTSYIKDGNLTVEDAISNYGVGMTHGFYSGKWYWEVLVSDVGQHLLGFLTLDDFDGQKSQPHNKFGSYLVYTNTSGQGIRYIEKSFSNITFSVSDGDIVQFALDRDNRKCWVGLNGTYIESGNPAGNSNPLFDSSDISATTGVFMPVFGTYGAQANKQTLNAGQDSSFVNQKTSGSANATDDNGFGDFYYTPPTGFLSACSNNVPTSDDIDPAQTDDDFPGKQCGVVTYTGNQPTGQTVSGLGFKPDLIWAKMRSSTQDNQLYNSQVLNSRNTPFMLRSNSTGAEIDDQAQGNNNEIISSFDTDGFTLGGSNSGPNDASRTYVAWCWKANGGTTASNSDGDITSTVQANTNAGFSIVTYTGDNTDHRGVGYGSANIGHGLNKAPEFIITKRRDSTGSWYTYHAGAGIGYLLLESNAVFQSGAVPFGPNAPTTTTFGAYSANNNSGATYVNYCWHSVEGYSKFGKYNGNADADGTFVYTGFRPRILIVRPLNVASDGWLMYDTERETFNSLDTILKPHSDAAEYSNAAFTLDIISNGFKLRSSDNAVNGTAYDPYIYMAWGDVPFKYGNTF